MTKTINKTMMTAAAALGMLFVATPARATEPALDAKAIEKMSKEADTAQEHAKVARQYRLRAEAFQVKAEKHEAKARQMRSTPNPMATKWPAMVSNGWERENRLAMEARRAAQECYASADRHIRLAVEGQLAAE